MAKKPVTLNELQEFFRALEALACDAVEIGRRAESGKIEPVIEPETALRMCAWAVRDITQMGISVSSAIRNRDEAERLKNFKL